MRSPLFNESCGLMVLALGLLMSCQPKPEYIDEPVVIRVPSGFPAIPFPADNAPTRLRIELGRILFYDTRLSLGNSVSCGTCHVLSAAFTDGRVTSTGIAGVPIKRNAPTLANIAWMPRLMMEGGVPTLEMQSLAPLHDTLEMGLNMMLAIHMLNKDEKLKALSKAAYGRDTLDPFVVTRSLAAFQRTIVSGDSRYDRYLQGQKDQMNAEELAGMALFFSERTQCNSCHSGVFFTDFGYHNIGLQENYTDHGKERATHREEDIGKFKTPTLRNIALTSPYMHDGSINSLEDVVAFYNHGGFPHANKDDRKHPLGLSADEERALVAFLGALTDWNFVQNQQLLPLER